MQELNEDEEMSVGTGTPPGLTVGDFITVKPKYQKKTNDRNVNQQTCFGDLNEQFGGQHRAREERPE